MAGSILTQIFTLISIYVNTWKARWYLQITTINLTTVLPVLPSMSLVSVLKILTDSENSGNQVNFLLINQVKFLLKAKAPTRRKPLKPPNMSLPIVGISIPCPPQDTGRMSLSTVYFPLVIKQDTLHNHAVCWTDAKCQMCKV